MATAIIYAKGQTSGSSFHLNSSWTSTSGPTVASTTIDYDFSSIPSGATINSVIVCATIGKRYSPNGGCATGYPKANGIAFQQTGVDEYTYQSESSVISDISLTTKVTYSFKAKYKLSDSGSGTMPFDDVYLLVTYTPLSSAWYLDNTSMTTGEALTGRIEESGVNSLYAHDLVLRYDDEVVYTYEFPSKDDLINNGVDEATATEMAYAINISVDPSWMQVYPNNKTGTFQLSLQTYDGINGKGSLLGESQPTEITITCADNMAPVVNEFTLSVVNGFGPFYLRNLSEARATQPALTTASETNIVCQAGATLKEVAISGNGKSVVCAVSDGADFTGLEMLTGTFKTDDLQFTITATVTDSRGMSTEIARWVSPIDYTPVTIQSAQVKRVQVDGVDNDTGQAAVYFTYTPVSYSDADGNMYTNNVTLTIECEGATVYSAEGYTSGTVAEFLSQMLDPGTLYPVRITVTDGLSVASVSKTIGTASVYMRWDPANNSVGFGCYPDGSNCVHIDGNWTLKIGTQTLQELIAALAPVPENIPNIVVSDTQPENPVEGLIWLDIS